METFDIITDEEIDAFDKQYKISKISKISTGETRMTGGSNVSLGRSNKKCSLPRISNQKPRRLKYNPSCSRHRLSITEALEIVSKLQTSRSDVQKKKNPEKRTRNRVYTIGMSHPMIRAAKEILAPMLTSKSLWHEISQEQVAKCAGVSTSTVNRVFLSLLKANLIVKYDSHYNYDETHGFLESLIYRLSGDFIQPKVDLITKSKEQIQKTVQNSKEKRKKEASVKGKERQRIGFMMKKLRINPFAKRECVACLEIKQNKDFSLIGKTATFYSHCQECFESGNLVNFSDQYKMVSI